MLWFRRVSAIALFLVCGTAAACLNEYGTTLSGESKLKSFREAPRGHSIDPEKVREKADKLRAAYEKDGRYEDASDLAVALLKLGETDEAIELLEWAEANSEEQYQVATNLGTAYELAGRNEDALEWIRIGLQRNPKSHGGSEWIHENLLLAKIAMAADPNWLDSNSVSGLEFGREGIPRLDREASAENCPEDISEIAFHLHTQLDERRTFIPGADPIVAALMFDLANAYALEYTVEEAVPVYQLARELQFHDPLLLEQRILALREIPPVEKHVHVHGSFARLAVFGAIVVAVVALVIVIGIVLALMRGTIKPT